MSSFRQVFHRVMDRPSTVCRCRYDLAQSLGTDIPHRKDTWNIGAAGLPCFHIALRIQVHLALQQRRIGISANADKHAVAGKFGFLTAVNILKPYAIHFLIIKQPGDFAVPSEFQILRFPQSLVIDLLRPEAVTTMYQNDPPGNS